MNACYLFSGLKDATFRWSLNVYMYALYLEEHTASSASMKNQDFQVVGSETTNELPLSSDT